MEKARSAELNLHVDELMSEDALLRLSAVAKLPLVLAALSPQRVEQELFPYLRYLLETQDNEDEFLVQLCQQLRQATSGRTAFGKEGAAQIFECLCALEDIRVREAAQRGLVELAAELLPAVQQAVTRLALSELVSARLSALELVQQLLDAGQAAPAFLAEADKVMRLLADDASLPVQRGYLRALRAVLAQGPKTVALPCAAQERLAEVAELLNARTPESLLFELLQPAFLTALDAALAAPRRAALLQSLLRLLSAEETSWRVRLVALENKKLLGDAWQADPARLTPLIALHTASPEAEVRAAAVRLLAHVAGTAEPAAFHRHLVAVVEGLFAEEKTPLVKRHLVFVCKALRAAGAERDEVLAQLGLRGFQRLLDDADGQVRLQALEVLREFLLDAAAEELPWPVLEALVAEKNWKLRLAALDCVGLRLSLLAQQPPAPREALQAWLQLNEKFGSDLVLTNRQRLVENLAAAAPLLKGEERLGAWRRLLLGWVQQPNHIFRVSALQALPRAAQLLPAAHAAQLATELFEALRGERVVNVKINMARTALELQQLCSAAAGVARAVCRDEDDPDVRAYLDLLPA